MWQVSSGLKENEMGSQGPQCHGGCQKFHFREFLVSYSQTSSCARKPLVLPHRCIVYTSMLQVSSGLKEDEMGSQGPKCHGGCQKFPFSIVFGLLHLCRSTSCFLAQELVWEQETEKYRKWNFLTPPMTLGALATHLILFQSWWDLPHTCIYYTSMS